MTNIANAVIFTCIITLRKYYPFSEMWTARRPPFYQRVTKFLICN